MTASDNAADANKIYIPAFQSYLIQTSGLTTSTIGNSIKSDEGSDPTAIQAIHTKDTDGTERWYNLNGIQIKNPTRKGIYIINGRKVIAKQGSIEHNYAHDIQFLACLCHFYAKRRAKLLGFRIFAVTLQPNNWQGL